jgi:pentatricopeptide repeat protein
MQNEGLLMGIPAFICGLKACRDLRDHSKGRELHIVIIKRGLLDDEVFIGSMLVDLYAHCGLPSEAQSVFDRLPVRDVVSWTVLIIGFTEHGNAEDALHYFEEMKQLSINRDAIILVCSLKACTSIGALEKGQEIHAEIIEKGLERGDFVRETLVDLYAKCGLLSTAQGVFDGLSVKDLDLWNALIAGYAQLGDYRNVCLVFERMEGEGVEPNSATFLHILSACSHAGLVAEGQMVFEAMNKHGKVESRLDHLFCEVMPNLDQFSREFLMPTLDHVSCIVDILGRAGCIDHVLYIIDRMPFHPDNVIWLTLLGACKKWGNVEHGRLAFDHAIRLKAKDVAAYVCMSNIYADAAKENRSGSWEDSIFSQPESLMVATF